MWNDKRNLLNYLINWNLSSEWRMSLQVFMHPHQSQLALLWRMAIISSDPQMPLLTHWDPLLLCLSSCAILSIVISPWLPSSMLRTLSYSPFSSSSCITASSARIYRELLANMFLIQVIMGWTKIFELKKSMKIQLFLIYILQVMTA